MALNSMNFSLQKHTPISTIEDIPTPKHTPMSSIEENPSNSEFTNPDEEDKTVTAAARLLCSFKQPEKYPNRMLILDQEETHALEEAVRIHKLKLQNNCRNLPAVPAVTGIIGECSQPFEKQLKKSDIKKGQMRLLLRKEHFKNYICPMLSPGDMGKLENKEAIKVTVYDFEGKTYEMDFKLWADKTYVLTNNYWKTFCTDHDLVKDEDWVKIWIFKHVDTKKLCFLIVPERKALSVATAGKKRISKKGSKKRKSDDE